MYHRSSSKKAGQRSAIRLTEPNSAWNDINSKNEAALSFILAIAQSAKVINQGGNILVYLC
jgi:hypothetical protein